MTTANDVYTVVRNGKRVRNKAGFLDASGEFHPIRMARAKKKTAVKKKANPKKKVTAQRKRITLPFKKKFDPFTVMDDKAAVKYWNKEAEKEKRAKAEKEKRAKRRNPGSKLKRNRWGQFVKSRR